MRAGELRERARAGRFRLWSGDHRRRGMGATPSGSAGDTNQGPRDAALRRQSATSGLASTGGCCLPSGGGPGAEGPQAITYTSARSPIPERRLTCGAQWSNPESVWKMSGTLARNIQVGSPQRTMGATGLEIAPTSTETRRNVVAGWRDGAGVCQSAKQRANHGAWTDRVQSERISAARPTRKR